MGKRSKLDQWLSQGGQRAIRAGVTGEVFTKVGGKLERESPAGEATQVSHILDPRLLLTDRQRATGQCYGGYALEVQTSGQTAFLREYVDRTVTGSGGASERHLDKLRMVQIAQKAVGELPAIVYPLGRSRGLGHVGKHNPIKPLRLLDGVCRDNLSLQAVAGYAGWLVERQGGKDQGKIVVPDRQRKHLAEALRCILDAIYDAWDSQGYSVDFEITRVIVK